MTTPSRGELWLVDLEPVIGHEQGLKRPALVISDDMLNRGPSGLVTIVPITKTARNIPLHVKVARGQGGLQYDSWILCDQVRTISQDRLIKAYESVDATVMANVEKCVKIALGLR